ncbi:alpha/beta fold hydrolase [Anaerococcus hydrogenalis]|uniref:Hydrolase, alpha/beta domain protein n=2 Tax=Anaerococcus hydrogenalis TaxID=33029 RepID=F0H1B5_9FIRM|nr:alpha/beta fold hydrolase [Anaerococcus hydrogenalis]EGC83748.1 hydrolase, alpha/beta domain protein [Anaerococcus hydrogenalis ACS-025-V-Sch4]
MNVVEKGFENNKIIILSPGYGTIGPGLDFLPLIDNLFKDFHVVAIEPFGYGDSDISGRSRSVENITSELHEAIKILGFRKYILCSHSISGIYSLYYLNKYKDEVIGFIGMDTSVPNQLKYTGNIFFPNLRKWANKLGFIRLISLFKSDFFIASNNYYSKEIKNQLSYRLYRDFANEDNLNEGINFEKNWKRIKNLIYPENIKKIFILVKKEKGKKDWRYIETKNSFLNKNGKIYLLEGSHYIFRDKFMEISKIIRDEFL